MYRRSIFGWMVGSSLSIAGLVVVLLGVAAASARAQAVPPHAASAGVEQVSGLLDNVVSTLAARGDSLWVGPHLQLTPDEGATWEQPPAPELERQRGNRLASLGLHGDTLVAGIATTAADAAAAAGFLVSTDAGRSFAFRRPHLDDGTEDTLRYGISRLPALPVTDPRESPPYDVAIGPSQGELWVAGGQSGLRRSSDFGWEWERVVLPPDHLDEISPHESYDFIIEPERDRTGFANYQAYSVLVDGDGIVWSGTGAGVNRSSQEDVFPEFGGDRRWQRVGAGPPGEGLTGAVVAALAEQRHPAGGSTIWMATWPGGTPGERFGVTYTRDAGESYAHGLQDERIHDFAVRGDIVFAAGANGLFILNSEGEIIHQITRFATPDQPGYEAPERLAVLAVAVTSDALWAGTAEGLFRSRDGGQTWRVFRTEVPVAPEVPSEAVPAAETYAYPNPFSPARSTAGVVRFVAETERAGDVSIDIFDFGMNVVRRLQDQCYEAGRCEVQWDGSDAYGRQVANGTYFYLFRTGDATRRGKVVVVD